MAGTGIIVSIVYGTCHFILLLMLCLKIYYLSMKTNDALSFRKFLYSIWKQRGIYSPVLIHIYDTATDIGVLVEWYKLAQIEKTDRNLESLDMEQFFWVGIGFMIAYRVIAAFYGAFLRLIDDDSYEGKCGACIQGILGMFLGFLELTIFASIYQDYKESKEKNKPYDQTGPAQKIAQLMEGVLESLPEVVMQSVFLMRAVNDDTLDESAGDIKELVIFSIFASLLSITNKYVWMDEFMVLHNAKSIFITEQRKDNAVSCDENREHKMIEAQYSKDEDGYSGKRCGECSEEFEDNDRILQCAVCGAKERLCFECRDYIVSHRDSFLIPLCRKGNYISYGYIIRVTWRLCAVLSRFIIFALIWVVLGGYYEIVLVPIMMIVWYILVCFMASYGHSDMHRAKKNARNVCWNCDDCEDCCVSSCAIFGIPFVIIIMGFVFQMGILGLAGRTLYIIRVIENIILMSVISVFSFVKFDCNNCADAEERYAFGNARILGWIIVGWSSVCIHCILSFFMPLFISELYGGDIHKVAQEFYETKEKRKKRKAEAIAHNLEIEMPQKTDENRNVSE